MNNTEKLKKYVDDFKSRQIPVKKENVRDEDFFKKRKEIIKSQNPMEDRLIVQNIRNIFGDIIKENFPFYATYETCFDNIIIGVYIHIWYYYMGKKEHYNTVVSLNKHLEENIKCFEDDLIDIKKDLISYPNNEIQQKFLREC